MATSIPVNGWVAFLNALTPGVAAANEIATTGSNQVVGTVVGVGQTAQSVVSLATSGMGGPVVATVPAAGMVLSAEGAALSVQNISDAYNNGGASAVQQSDVAGLIGNLSGLLGNTIGAAALVLEGTAVGAAATAATPVIIGLAVVGLAAGAYQVIAGTEGWTLNSVGQWISTTLTPDQAAQAAAMVQSINANPDTLASTLNNLGIAPTAPGTYLVPTIDSSGNLTGFTQETPIATQSLGKGQTQYTFPDGTTLTNQSSYTNSSGQLVVVVPEYDNVWTMPIPGGGTAQLQTDSVTGSYQFNNGTSQVQSTIPAGELGEPDYPLEYNIDASDASSPNGITSVTYNNSNTADGSSVQTITDENANGGVQDQQVIDSADDGTVTDNVSGTGAVVEASDANVVSTNGEFTLDATGDTLSGYYNTVTLDAGSSATETTGTNTIDMDAGSSVISDTTSSANTINAGAGDSVEIASTNGYTDVINAALDQGIVLGANTSVSVNGDGNTIAVAGSDNVTTDTSATGDTLDGSNVSFTLSNTSGAVDTALSQ